MQHIEETLVNALKPIVPVVCPRIYRGDAKEYITFDYTTYGTTFGEGRPTAEIYLVSVHHYLPEGENPHASRARIKAALVGCGCTWPEITDAGDEDGQHWVFECQWKDGVPNG